MSLATFLLMKSARSCKLDHTAVRGCLAFLGNHVSGFLSLISGICNHRNMEWLRLKESSDGQVGQGWEQPYLVKDVPALSRGVGVYNLQRSLVTQTFPLSCEQRMGIADNFEKCIFWSKPDCGMEQVKRKKQGESILKGLVQRA